MLKESKNIDYVLEKPKIEQQIDEMLKEIYQSKPANVAQNKLQELKLVYDRTINDKIKLLTDLTQSAQQNPENLKELKAEIHKISGSAGSFGYASVSVICKKKETEIGEKMASGNYKDVQWLSSLDEFIKKVKKGFQTSTFVETPSIPKPFLTRKPSIYIVDDDVYFLDLLERVKEEFPIELTVEFDPQKALAQLNSPNFNPNGIIVAETFRSSSLKGFDIINALLNKNISPSPIYGLLLEQENIDIRIEATQKGINYIFRKPVSSYILLKTMADALGSKSPHLPKVLVVDDDEDFCNFVIAVLAEIDISTFAIFESANLFKALEEYRPNILLLDLVLPKYNGLNLLKTLRQDVTFKNLIIVIVTSSEQLDTSLNAYAANVDDILFKPIDKNLLQKRILNIAQRWVPSNDTTACYTGLGPLKELMNELNESQKQGQPESHLVLFKIQDYANWINQNGYSAAKDLMVFISNELRWETDSTMQCFLYQLSVFAIIFDDMKLEAIDKKMFKLLSLLVQKELRWHLAFECSIVPISKNFVNASKILQTAEEGLAEAREKEAASIKIVHRLPKGELVVKKEVMIVDSDHDLLKILKKAFEAHGIIVSTFSEGGDALKQLLTYSENHLPSLIIVERKLPDMDGMELYVKLKTRFRSSIPCFILTVFSADKDVSDGIRQGVLEYIVKPFNISILVQKALQVIFKG